MLKAWNREDPVDAREQLRDQRISAHQDNRNPFVEDASLAERVSDFQVTSGRRRSPCSHTHREAHR